MCRKLVVTNQIFLGKRAICYEAYSLPKGEVVELTEKQIKDALKGITTDEIYGLALSDAGELVFDTENFFTVNMMKKVHTNTLIPMLEDDCLANLFYIVLGTHKEKGNLVYDVISSHATTIEVAINKALRESGFSERFKFNMLDIEDKLRRVQIEQTKLDAGILTVNEVRDGYNLPPVEWGNYPLQQNQLNTMSDWNSEDMMSFKRYKNIF